MGSYYMIILSLVNTFPSFFLVIFFFFPCETWRKSVLYSKSFLVRLLSHDTCRLQIPEVSVHAHTTVCKPAKSQHATPGRAGQKEASCVREEEGTRNKVTLQAHTLKDLLHSLEHLPPVNNPSKLWRHKWLSAFVRAFLPLLIPHLWTLLHREFTFKIWVFMGYGRSIS